MGRALNKEALDILFAEYFNATFCHSFQDHLPDLYADEFLDEISVGFKEAAHFAFFAVVEVYFEAAGMSFAHVGRGDDFFCFEKITIIFNPVEQFGDVGFIEIAVQYDAVTFNDLIAGVGQSMGEVAIVGDDEESFAVFIEAPRAKHALALEVGREEFKDGLTTVRVGVGAKKALRFIEDEGHGASGFGGKRLLVDEDGISREPFVAQLCDFPVVAHCAVFNQALRFTARTQARVGDDFLEAFCFFF